MTYVLDSGALIALERNDRRMWIRLKSARQAGKLLVTHGAIVGQTWRSGGPRQALLARALAAVAVIPLDEALGRAAGRLLFQTGHSDVVDAALVLLADEGDQIFTSDLGDVEQLVAASGKHVELMGV